MAYQNVATPRFYINDVEWLITTMDTQSSYRHYHTLPVNPIPYFGQAISPFSISFLRNKSFIAILGHNGGSYSISTEAYLIPVVNAGSAGANPDPEYAGFSISTFDGSGISSIKAMGSFTAGSILIGTYYDMTNSPNLNLTLSYEYGGVNETTTKNGSTFSNTLYTKPPMWGNLGAWELGDSTNQLLSRSGRKSWDLKFSYISDSDLWGSNQMLSFNAQSITETLDYEADDIQDSTGYRYNLLTDDSFFSQVWHKTLGGTLPFIFQPDGDGDTPGSGNNNPDQFAICRIAKNSLKATQSAFNVYDISVTIEEVW